jgi:hypothetical protein
VDLAERKCPLAQKNLNGKSPISKIKKILKNCPSQKQRSMYMDDLPLEIY